MSEFSYYGFQRGLYGKTELTPPPFSISLSLLKYLDVPALKGNIERVLKNKRILLEQL